MATVIDSFLVVLGLDSSSFDKGRKQTGEGFKKTRDEAEKTGGALDDFGKKSGAAIVKLRNEAIGLFLAFQGASSIKDFVGNMITGDAAAGRLAKNLGVGVTELTAYGLAIQSVGGKVEDANASFQLLAASREQLKLTGTTGHDREFMLLGFGPHDLDNTTTAFEKLAVAAQRMPRTQFYNLAHQLGLGDGAINLLELGPTKMGALVEARKKDAAATEAQAEEAQKLQDKWVDLMSKITGVFRPGIYALVETTTDWADSIGKAIDAAPGMATALGIIAVAAIAAVSPVAALVAAIVGLIALYPKLKAIRDENERQKVTRDVHGNSVQFGHYVGDVGAKSAQIEHNPDGSSVMTWKDRALHWVDTGNNQGHWEGVGSGVQNRSGVGPRKGQKVDPYFRPVDPNAKPDATTAGAGAAKGPVNNQSVYEALKAGGLPDDQARGVAAGVAAEGGGLGQARKGGFGIGQWLGHRRDVLLAKYGPAPTLGQQIEFLLAELRGTAGDGERAGSQVLAQRGAAQTMVAYLSKFMRPQGAHGEKMADLIADVQRGYRALGQATPAGLGGRSSTVSIGTINLPGVKDAHGFAGALPDAIRRRAMTAQADRGLD